MALIEINHTVSAVKPEEWSIESQHRFSIECRSTVLEFDIA